MWEANMNLLGFKAIMVIFFLQFVRQHKMHNGAHSFPFLCFLKFLVIMSCNASMNGSTVVDNCISLHLVLRWHHRIYNVLWICLWFVNCHGYSIRQFVITDYKVLLHMLQFLLYYVTAWFSTRENFRDL